MTSSWFFLSTLNYDARSTTHQILFHVEIRFISLTILIPWEWYIHEYGDVFWRRTVCKLILSLSIYRCCISKDRKPGARRWEKLKSDVCNDAQTTEILYLLVLVSVQSGVAQDWVFLELPADVRVFVSSPRIFDRFQPLLFGERGLLRRYGELSREWNRTLTFWRRIFFLILAHPVYKMWIIQEPNTLELWNKLHFEKKITESIYRVLTFGVGIIFF